MKFHVRSACFLTRIKSSIWFLVLVLSRWLLDIVCVCIIFCIYMQHLLSNDALSNFWGFSTPNNIQVSKSFQVTCGGCQSAHAAAVGR